MTLIILLAVVVAVSLLVGRLAHLAPKELVAQTLLMSAAALAFYGLVALL